MTIIDAYTGQDVAFGVRVPAPSPPDDPKWWVLLAIEDKFFSATAVLQTSWMGLQRVPLIVRFTHPGFFLQRIGFIPS